MHFEFATATRILFGPGKLKEVTASAQSIGKKALLVTGKTPDRATQLLDSLRAHNIETATVQIASEPTTDIVLEGTTTARNSNCDFVIGIGGGSVLDGAKAIAAFMTNDGEPSEYLEVVGQGKPLQNIPAPWIAIPTTAGTGAEVTKNAVLGSKSHKMKVSLRSPLLFARLAVVDPELTLDLPPALTASTGLDALTQLIEPYVSIRANPVSDALCLEGLRRCARALRRCYENGSDLEARSDMALASLLGGLALANSGLGAVHGFASPLGGEFDAPHGAVCAALLPHVMQANVRALQRRESGSSVLKRYDEIAHILTGKSQATVEDGIAWILDLCTLFEIPALQSYGINQTDLPALVEKSAHASSMKANPIELTSEELLDILVRAV